MSMRSVGQQPVVVTESMWLLKSLRLLGMLMRFFSACACYWLLASDMVYASTQGGGKTKGILACIE